MANKKRRVNQEQELPSVSDLAQSIVEQTEVEEKPLKKVQKEPYKPYQLTDLAVPADEQFPDIFYDLASERKKISDFKNLSAIAVSSSAEAAEAATSLTKISRSLATSAKVGAVLSVAFSGLAYVVAEKQVDKNSAIASGMGTVTGLAIGSFFPPLGWIIGPAIGAYVFEAATRPNDFVKRLVGWSVPVVGQVKFAAELVSATAKGVSEIGELILDGNASLWNEAQSQFKEGGWGYLKGAGLAVLATSMSIVSAPVATVLKYGGKAISFVCNELSEGIDWIYEKIGVEGLSKSVANLFFEDPQKKIDITKVKWSSFSPQKIYDVVKEQPEVVANLLLGKTSFTLKDLAYIKNAYLENPDDVYQKITQISGMPTSDAKKIADLVAQQLRIRPEGQANPQQETQEASVASHAKLWEKGKIGQKLPDQPVSKERI